jgi:protein-S-isoprenylcysteine O-methyltransferase Ste14
MDPDSAHTSYWAIGETVFGIPLMAGIALQIFFPIVLSKGLLRIILLFLGIILFLLGWVVISLARKELARMGQPTDPGQPTVKIVTTGVFSISRNPMYLGCSFLLLGLSFLVNSPYMLGMLLITIVVCEIVLIRPEERYLQRKFGMDYDQYSRSVGRWLRKK